MATYPGREGPFCEEDVDGCALSTCFEGTECTDVQAPGSGFICGSCPVGFIDDGGKCAGMLHDTIVTNTYAINKREVLVAYL